MSDENNNKNDKELFTDSALMKDFRKAVQDKNVDEAIDLLKQMGFDETYIDSILKVCGLR